MVIPPQYEQADTFAQGMANVVLNEIDYSINLIGDTTRIIKMPWSWEPYHANADYATDIRGGSQNGTPLCIGRANYRLDPFGGIHPGKIKKDTFSFGWGGEEQFEQDFEILLMDESAEYKWLAHSKQQQLTGTQYG